MLQEQNSSHSGSSESAPDEDRPTRWAWSPPAALCVPHLFQNFTDFYDLFSVGSGCWTCRRHDQHRPGSRQRWSGTVAVRDLQPVERTRFRWCTETPALQSPRWFGARSVVWGTFSGLGQFRCLGIIGCLGQFASLERQHIERIQRRVGIKHRHRNFSHERGLGCVGGGCQQRLLRRRRR